MKKIIFVMLFVVACGFISSTAEAATARIVQLSSKPSFDLKLSAVNKILGSNKSKFDYVTNLQNAASVDHWKMRVACSKDIQVGFGNANTDICGKVQTLTNAEAAKNFSLFMTKGANAKRVSFSFKLKAYDKNDKWLYSDGETIKW